MSTRPVSNRSRFLSFSGLVPTASESRSSSSLGVSVAPRFFLKLDEDSKILVVERRKKTSIYIICSLFQHRWRKPVFVSPEAGFGAAVSNIFRVLRTSRSMEKAVFDKVLNRLGETFVSKLPANSLLSRNLQCLFQSSLHLDGSVKWFQSHHFRRRYKSHGPVRDLSPWSIGSSTAAEQTAADREGPRDEPDPFKVFQCPSRGMQQGLSAPSV